MRSMLLSIVLVVGCSSEAATEPPVTGTPPSSCPPGEWQDADGSCVPAGLPPDMPCPPGEWLRDDGQCIPAGVPPDGCGEGFAHDGDRGCEPILPGEPCPPGLMAVPGETMCREVAPCAPGKWGDIPVDSDTEYVDASYPGTDSDGSALKPWTRIQDGVDAAAAGALVAIAAGTYQEDVTVSGKAVRLRGVCPALVEVVGTGAEIAAIVLWTGATATEVTNLAIRGEAVGFAMSGSLDVLLSGVWVHDTGGRGALVENDFGPTSITLQGVLVEQTYEIGMFVAGSEVTMEASVVRATSPNAQGFGGRGVNARVDSSTGAATTLVLERSVVEQSRDVGVYVEGSQATVEASVVRLTQSDAREFTGYGIQMRADATTGAPATLVAARSFIDKNLALGVMVVDSVATVEASVVRATAPITQGIGGRGVHMHSESTTGALPTLLLRHSLIDQNHEAGVNVEGSEATIEASVVRATAPNAQGLSGRGIGVQPHGTTGAPATLLVRASLVEENHEIGIFVEDSQATVDASIVRATQLDAQGISGRGVAVQGGATTGTLVLRASIVEQSHEGGVFIAGSEATVESSVVRATQPNADGLYGRGVHVQDHRTTGAPSTLLLQSSLIEENLTFGVTIVSSHATVASCHVRDTFAGTDGAFGDGVVVFAESGPASATLSSTRVERSARAAVSAFGAHAALADSALTCQAFDIDHEIHQGIAATLEDLGGNHCGCPEPNQSCKSVSANLEPPSPLGSE